MGIPHVHAKLIKAWADGAEIQWFSEATETWIDMKPDWLRWEATLKYRLKPIPLKYRLYLYTYDDKDGVAVEMDELSAAWRPREDGFVKWLGDWQEVES